MVSATGDAGTANVDKQGNVYPFPTAQWPASSPFVTAAGGTWLQYGWTWDPTVSAATYYSCLAAGAAFNTRAAPCESTLASPPFELAPRPLALMTLPRSSTVT